VGYTHLPPSTMAVHPAFLGQAHAQSGLQAKLFAFVPGHLPLQCATAKLIDTVTNLLQINGPGEIPVKDPTMV